MQRFRLIHRGSRRTYYAFDTRTGRRASLGTSRRAEAQRLVDARNEAVRQPEMNLQIAQVYLQHGDPALAGRTWQDVMDAMLPLKTGPTRIRWRCAMQDAAFNPLRRRKLRPPPW